MPLALGASAFALFGPTGIEVTETEVPEGSFVPVGENERRWTSTWGQIRAGEEDAFVVAVLAFPVAVALAALALEPTRVRRGSRVVAAGLVTAFAVVTGFSVGLWFFPAAAAMLAAAAVRRPRSDRRAAAPG